VLSRHRSSRLAAACSGFAAYQQIKHAGAGAQRRILKGCVHTGKKDTPRKLSSTDSSMKVSRNLARACLRAGLVLLIILSTAPLLPVTATAMSVSPVYLDMVSTGPRSRADIRVINRSDRPLPIEAVVSRITHEADGQETVTRNNADFLVLPMQAMIPPGGRQILKVQWLGDPLITESREYRISVNQLPVTQPGEASAVQVVMNIAVVVTVAPPKGRPALELVDTGTADTGDGERRPVVTVRNPSKVHARLPHATLRLRAGGWDKVLSPATLQALLGIGAVMPGRTRSFQIPLPLPDTVKSVEADLDYRPPRRR